MEVGLRVEFKLVCMWDHLVVTIADPWSRWWSSSTEPYKGWEHPPQVLGAFLPFFLLELQRSQYKGTLNSIVVSFMVLEFSSRYIGLGVNICLSNITSLSAEEGKLHYIFR